jgi:hypothetical protein
MSDLKYRLKYDKKFYFANVLKIKDKNAKIVQFIVTPSQDRLIRVVEKWKEEFPDPNTRPTLYIIILKARQLGFSTCTEGIIFHELNFRANAVGLVVSFDNDSSKNINDMSDRFYQHMPQSIKPMRRQARGKGILFENPTKDLREFQRNPGLQSKFLIGTAGNENVGSSYTINYLHISELAKWPGDQKTQMDSLLQVVPKYNSIVIVESTAKGFGNLFHKLWTDAEEGKNGYVPIFVAWHEQKEYSLDFINDDERREFEASLDTEEKWLIDTYKVSLEQLKWRRDTIKKKCSNDVNTFHQEYPSYPEEAFLSSGCPVFDTQKIQARKKYLEEHPIGEKGYIDSKGEFVRDNTSPFIIYERPQKDTPYVLIGDVAEGIPDGDYSGFHIMNNITGNQAAVYRGHIAPDLYSLEIIKAGRYYNNALAGIEVNNHGLTVVTKLQDLHYPRQYEREVIDDITNARQKKNGWQTTTATRPVIIDDVREWFRECLHLINDVDTLTEALTFVFKDNGKAEHEDGCHDDLIISLALFTKVRVQQSKQLFNQYKPVQREYDPRTGY